MTVASKPRLILHVGSHKTGTTSIQGALAANRSWLDSLGVCYPDPTPFFFHRIDGHHDLAHALASTATRHRRRAAKFRAHLIDMGRTHDRIVLSAEPFYRHVIEPSPIRPRPRRLVDMLEERRLYIAAMADYFSPFDVEILVFLRRPDTFAESLYKNSVVQGWYSGGFQRFSKSPYFVLDYGRRLDLFRSSFPKVTVKSYEQSLPAGIIEAFFEAIGVGNPPTPGGEHLRRSLTNKATLWIERSKAEQKLGKRAIRRRWHFAMLPVSKPLFGSDKTSSLWNSVDERDRFIERHRGAVAADLFPSPPPDLPGPATWTDEEHAAASDAFGRWQRQHVAYLLRRDIQRVPPFEMQDPPGFLRYLSAEISTRLGRPSRR